MISVYILLLHYFVVSLTESNVARTENKTILCEDQEDLKIYDRDKIKNPCWPEGHHNIFEELDKIDEKYKKVRESINNAAKDNKFDDHMVMRMVDSRARGIHTNPLPAGFNIGGYSLMKMNDSLFVFFRMKLRNETRFHVRKLHNDLENMQLHAKLDLNELHLVGEYDRSLLFSNTLLYRPTHGTVHILLQNAKLDVNGRYRVMGDTLLVEHIVSQMVADEYRVVFSDNIDSKNFTSFVVDKTSIDSFLRRVQRDLNYWLQDYFNDYLQHCDYREAKPTKELQMFDHEKQGVLNEEVDMIIKLLNKNLHNSGANILKIPEFRIMTLNGLKIDLHDGHVHGLSGLYRRSIATVQGDHNIRYVVANVGFHLNVEYSYKTIINEQVPSLTGDLKFISDDVRAQMHLVYLRDGGLVDMYLDFIDCTKVENLIVEGAANRYLSNIRHLIEHDIIALMSNGMIHSIFSLESLMKCEPNLPGYDH